jgi:MinD superfamily P-loop ATPase
MIFVCYSRNDITIAAKLVKDLKSKGIEVWIDYLNLDTSLSLEPQLIRAIKNCDRMVIIHSDSSMNSNWVKFEKKIAIKNKKKVEIINADTLI